MRPLPANARDSAASRNLRFWGSCIRELLGTADGTAPGPVCDGVTHSVITRLRCRVQISALYRNLRIGTRSIARGRPKLPEPVPRPDALARMRRVARAVVQSHPRMQLTSWPLVEPAAGVLFELVAELVREAPAPGSRRDTVLRADLQDVPHGRADEPIEKRAWREPGREHQIRPGAADRLQGVEPQHGAAQPDPGDVDSAQLPPLAGVHARARIGPRPR